MKTYKMPLVTTIQIVFDELAEVIETLTDNQYSKPCAHLTQTGIGQHVRHVVELFQCLLDGYETGVVNYELRKRDKRIETDRQFALSLMTVIAGNINRPDKDLQMQCLLGGDTLIQTRSNYQRELIYNLEHTIHHMALIRVGVEEVSDIILLDSFGVAPSTIQYRKECAQ